MSLRASVLALLTLLLLLLTLLLLLLNLRLFVGTCEVSVLSWSETQSPLSQPHPEVCVCVLVPFGAIAAHIAGEDRPYFCYRTYLSRYRGLLWFGVPQEEEGPAYLAITLRSMHI